MHQPRPGHCHSVSRPQHSAPGSLLLPPLPLLDPRSAPTLSTAALNPLLATLRPSSARHPTCWPGSPPGGCQTARGAGGGCPPGAAAACGSPPARSGGPAPGRAAAARSTAQHSMGWQGMRAGSDARATAAVRPTWCRAEAQHTAEFSSLRALEPLPWQMAAAPMAASMPRCAGNSA